jgi:hypothetical protein
LIHHNVSVLRYVRNPSSVIVLGPDEMVRSLR